MIAYIHVSQEIFAIIVLTALKSSLEHRRKQVLRLLQLYGDQALSLVPTCPKNRKNREFLRFPDNGILAILGTASFALIGRIATACGIYLLNGVETMTEKFYHLKFVL